MSNNNTTSRNNNTTTKGNKGMKKSIKDNNAVVTDGSIINGAKVTEKRQQAVVLEYSVNGNTCNGVMHVSQFPSTDRVKRDELFAAANVGDVFDNLKANVEGPDEKQGRRFTTVRLSGRAIAEQTAEQQRQAAKEARQNRETALANAIASVDGKVVKATIKDLALAKDKETGKETDHCYGAFLKTVVGDVEVSGLLHTSRMTGRDRVQQLIDLHGAGQPFDALVTVTEKGVAFSLDGVKEAKEQEATAKREQAKASERDSFLSLVRDAIAGGTNEKMPIQAKVTANRLATGGGISAEGCGCRFEVSSADLDIPAENMKGVGHTVKLVPVSVNEDGVITGKRYKK
ncbi:MAG: hypothetical protein K2X27_00115 [Candidatus Obscuribacterales bacterium]|nr:hypothetical protein [Candidatus Obscuribacterales bacterium]